MASITNLGRSAKYVNQAFGWLCGTWDARCASLTTRAARYVCRSGDLGAGRWSRVRGWVLFVDGVGFPGARAYISIFCKIEFRHVRICDPNLTPWSAVTVYDESTAIEGGPDSMGEWRPRATPPIGVDLNNEQKLACAFRILARDGFSENMAGHITWADRDDDSLLINRGGCGGTRSRLPMCAVWTRTVL